MNQLEKFEQFWSVCTKREKDTIKNSANGWHECKSAFWGSPEVVNALNNAGAITRVFGIDGPGNWAIQVMWYGDFDRGVFAIMGIDDPDMPAQSGADVIPF
jgi:hypothetical protein